MGINVNIVDGGVEDFKIVDESFKIYDVELNGSDLSFNSSSEVRFDVDSDVRVTLSVDEEVLLDHVCVDDIIKYLEKQGYTITEGE